MDCQMPVMDGFTATRQIREREARAGGGARLPVIALTANVMSEDRDNCRAAGMDGHLGKPLDPALLAACLARHLSSRAAPPAIDRAALLVVTGGDAEFERELIETFIASGDEHLAAIVAALAQGDFVTIGRRAHALKGASANLHARPLAETAAHLEHAANGRATAGLDGLVRTLGAQLGQFRSQLA
jgi:HPt (histidine-containing phosphotransfer) domain-containing protein